MPQASPTCRERRARLRKCVRRLLAGVSHDPLPLTTESSQDGRALSDGRYCSMVAPARGPALSAGRRQRRKSLAALALRKTGPTSWPRMFSAGGTRPCAYNRTTSRRGRSSRSSQSGDRWGQRGRSRGRDVERPPNAVHPAVRAQRDPYALVTGQPWKVSTTYVTPALHPCLP
jgi:hypothetical protein